MSGMKVSLPLTEQMIHDLRCGDQLLLSGFLYTARDAAHKRLVESLSKNGKLPVELKGQAIYYAGPTPAPPGRVIGSAGPTTSQRMDSMTIPLLEYGVKGLIGKGSRSEEVKKALVQHKAVYLAATGGAGALLAQRIKSAEVVAYEDLGPEAIYKLEVQEFPVVVINDINGNDLYEAGQKAYKRLI